MPDYVVPPAAPVALPVVGSDALFAVRRVYCIGRNYADHAREMGHDPDREPPFFFQKNPNNLSPTPTFPYPSQSSDVHHEAEMAIALHSGGSNISTENALSHVYGYAAALDMTRRDLQATAKAQGRPWEIGKAFEHSAPIGPIHPVVKTGHLNTGPIRLLLNDTIKQEGNLNQMIWKVPEMIAFLSTYFTLAAGDVILSGTPAGVGPVIRGDVMTLSIAELAPLTVTVT
ncbi:fumarylacetoacetate hydrolase family protein [Shimia marina]|uniref:Fumarylpyruvate hydrolase n=1 Tax=Shimia marina TaxID=321267 RepID=A0A0P1EKV6_9RHOB|nr:fumarylacetoacetate hydrolase family protein [Shimia marina]CUH50792.1 Fumarylpyruvate hydrolase [Shimia marina]SFE66040.1 fumarylpyruvate hydrolase [Shimia marina]